MNSMFDCDVTISTSHKAEGFVAFFKEKIDDIRAATAGTQPPPVSQLRCWRRSHRALNMKSGASSWHQPTKSCSLDPVQTFLLHESVNLLLPYITNASLTQGRLPVSQRHAIITPRLKKPGLNATHMANCRPVSNVSFISKLVERVVAARLHAYLSTSGLLPPCQSAYRKSHSTETAMLRVGRTLWQQRTSVK